MDEGFQMPGGAGAVPRPPPAAVKWAKVIDQQRCIGCHACTTACKSENDVPLSVTRTYVKYVDVGVFPLARRAFQVTRCNQCDDAPCTAACPTGAMFRRPDGIVDFDKSICIGCKACIAACPYDAIFINPEDHAAEKCNFCAHRLDVGLEPACVVVCPTEAILVGDLGDPDSQVARIVHREPVAVRRPEKDTRPKLFYRGAHQATLDPLAARRPPGGLFSWSEQQQGGDLVVSGYPGQASDPGRHPAGNSAAAAVLAYDVAHGMPWDWRVSLYTLTKGIAAGVYLVAVLLLALGRLSAASPVWLFAVPVLGGLFLAATGALLIWDLEHPERFYLIFTRPQWRSWLVRGAFLIGGYAAVLALHFLAAVAGRPDLARLLIWPGLPLALLTAVYTAYLFAQAKARDLWQNPLLPPHLTVQAVLAGAAVLAPAAIAVRADLRLVARLLAIVAAAGLAHLALVAGECTLTHATAHARLAVREMLRGRYRLWFWAGVVLVAAGVAAASIGAMASSAEAIGAAAVAGTGGIAGGVGMARLSAAAVYVLTIFWTTALAPLLALLGLLAFEHAYVQAGQAVPLA
ncbi:MAG TPA: 4Fe-4S dicluster domain-containing protein [Thermoanaerobaculia bacterium]|nr:4Fe-4S dicluster domain-containing protein [Thermoanaerobaculia bacterium]